MREVDGHSYEGEEWLERATKAEGSWWTEWAHWLDSRSGKPVPPPSVGAPDKGYPPIADAPGHYILEK